jgi:RND family efflux transporter MFP subunit
MVARSTPASETAVSRQNDDSDRGLPPAPTASSSPPVSQSSFGNCLRRWGWLFVLSVVGLSVAIAVREEASSAVSLVQAADETVVPPALPVQVMAVESVVGYETERVYTGEIVARRSSDLGFELGGKVVSLHVDEGDMVAAGELIARLDTASLDAQRRELEAQAAVQLAQLQELEAGPRQQTIDAAQAAVDDLQAQLELSQIQEARRLELYQGGAIARDDYDQQSFNTASLTSRLNQAQRQLDELRAGTRVEQVNAQDARLAEIQASIDSLDVQLAKSVLYAPFSGEVSRRVVDEGTVISVGAPIVTLMEGGVIEARFGLPSDRAANVTLGSTQTIAVGTGKTGDRTYTGTVSRILPEVDPQSRTVTVVVELPSHEALRAGQTVRLKQTERQSLDGVWVPSTALVPGSRGLWSLYVLGAADEVAIDTFVVAKRDVEVLHTEGDRMLVRGTVRAGDRAIVSGIQRIVPGQRVTPST